MSDRGKREREGERLRVKKWKWLTWCHAASLHRIPVGREEGEGKKNHCVCFIRQIYRPPSVSCCGTSYLTLNELSECLPQQVNKSVIPHCGHGCRVNVESIR